METTIIVAHPWEGSFNHAILERVQASLEKRGKSYRVLNLVQDQFDPVMGGEDLALYSRGESTDAKVQEYRRILSGSDELVFIFPIWWAHMPAVLKGFIDKVFLKGFAYEVKPSGLLRGLLTHIRTAYVITTSDAPNWYYSLLLHAPLKYSFNRATLKACGIGKVVWMNLGTMKKNNHQSRSRFLSKVGMRLG